MPASRVASLTPSVREKIATLAMLLLATLVLAAAPAPKVQVTEFFMST